MNFFASGAPLNPAQCWPRITVGDPPRGGASDILDILSERCGAAVIPGQGVPGEDRNTDGDMRELHVPLCAGNLYNC